VELGVRVLIKTDRAGGDPPPLYVLCPSAWDQSHVLAFLRRHLLPDLTGLLTFRLAPATTAEIDVSVAGALTLPPQAPEAKCVVVSLTGQDAEVSEMRALLTSKEVVTEEFEACPADQAAMFLQAWRDTEVCCRQFGVCGS
jgi:hypothetical protein